MAAAVAVVAAALPATAAAGSPLSKFAFRVTTPSSVSIMTLPAVAVAAGLKWTFAADSQVTGGGRAVDFYSATSGGSRTHHAPPPPPPSPGDGTQASTVLGWGTRRTCRRGRCT